MKITPRPQSVHPADAWQNIQKYHQTTEQLSPPTWQVYLCAYISYSPVCKDPSFCFMNYNQSFCFTVSSHLSWCDLETTAECNQEIFDSHWRGSLSSNTQSLCPSFALMHKWYFLNIKCLLQDIVGDCEASWPNFCFRFNFSTSLSHSLSVSTAN